MKRNFLILLVVCLIIASFTGFLYLNHKINHGNMQIANGKEQLARGEKALSEGQSALQQGEGQLSQGKGMYKDLKKSSYMAALMAPVAGAVILASDQVIRSKIKNGSEQVANGKKEIQAGQARLSQGKLELHAGMEKLSMARMLRAFCAIATLFFIALLIALKFYK